MLDIFLAILVIALYAILVGFTFYCWIETFSWGFEVPMFAVAIILTLLCLLPVGFIYDKFKESKATTETSIVEVEIIDKNYSPARTTFIFNGKTTIPIITSERYDVTLSDGELERTIDNEDLYNKLEAGDSFKINKVMYKDKNGKVFKQDFELIGDN